MDNLFIIRSPLQILNAYEAIKYFNLQNIILVLIYNSGENNTYQMKSLVSIIKHDTLIELEDYKRTKFFRYLKLINTLKDNKFQYIFSGNFGTINRLLMANLKAEQLFLIDDGTSSIISHRKIHNYFLEPKFDLREFRYRIFRLESRINQKIDFFTIFDLPQIANEIIIQHKFENLSNKFLNEKKLDFNLVYFLGQNLTQAKIVSKEKYIFYIQTIIEKYKDKKIVYIPHRTEILHYEIKQLESENFEILFPNLPVEIYFLKLNILPFEIISFHSTALYTLKLILKQVKIKAFKINIQDIEKLKQTVEFCQEFLTKAKIEFNEVSQYEKV